MDKEDSGILALFTDNSDEAFKLMFDRYYSALCVVARMYTGDQAAAEDIVQQVFIVFWEQKCYQRVTISIKAYLQTSVRNASLNFLQKKKNIDRNQAGMPCDAAAGQALDFLLNREEQKVIEKAISELPEQCRKVFEMVYFEDTQYKAVAENLQISVNTVKSHLRNALRILKNNARLKLYYQVIK